MKCVEMAHGLNPVLKRNIVAVNGKPEGKTGIGSRRIFSPQFKLQVLDSYRNDADCKGNQRATARKYGIHRRQIQKWLQAETALRNGVSGKHINTNNGVEYNHAASLSGHRQRDDEAIVGSANQAQAMVEARVPALEPPSGWQANQAPLDFTTHTRSSPTLFPSDPATPIDLSFKRTSLTAPVLMLATRSPLTVLPPLCRPTSTAESPNSLPSQPDVWDLSTKGLKRKLDERDASSQTSPKPVKLFKPYLDDLKDNDSSDSPPNQSNLSPPPLRYETLESPPQALYCCEPPITCSPDIYYLNNNNNLCCEIKPDSYTPGYTLHELQPKSYYSAFYPYSPSDYELSPTYCPYEDPLYSGAPLKQRQSYSLDFKLRTIDSYYQDSICKGNQRAVATKYNIHRRQVQKWLKQEDELKAKNENMKQIPAVR